MLSVELTNLADILDDAKLGQNFSQLARSYSSTIEEAVWKTTVGVFFPYHMYDNHLYLIVQVVDNIFAYETNGVLVSRFEEFY